MIPRECKRLAEVDFPIAEVSRHAVKEKSLRRGHPSTLHLWWARRPLASSRAVLLGLLWPDPVDKHCPESFKETARQLLPLIPSCAPGNDDEGLRRALIRFIADFAEWNLAARPKYLDIARALVAAAQGDEAPLVVDPFAGGGSIPIEALRLGCDAFASDLNPVACLILSVMLEDIPQHGQALGDDLRETVEEIKRQAKTELADLYPPDPDGARPIAYLWARTVRCEMPDCGAEIPLMRSFWLRKRRKPRQALRVVVRRMKNAAPSVDFKVFSPEASAEVPSSTVVRAKATCLCCGAVVVPGRVRAQLAEQRGGADVVFDNEGQRIGGARLTAVVTRRAGRRSYRNSTVADYEAVHKAQKRATNIVERWERNKSTDSMLTQNSGGGGGDFVRYRMNPCRRLEPWASAYNATACANGARCFRQDRRLR